MCGLCLHVSKYLWNENTEIFDVIDCSFLLLLPIQNIILLIVNTSSSAFVVSYFRGPRPMSTRGGQAANGGYEYNVSV